MPTSISGSPYRSEKDCPTLICFGLSCTIIVTFFNLKLTLRVLVAEIFLRTMNASTMTMSCGRASATSVYCLFSIGPERR